MEAAARIALQAVVAAAFLAACGDDRKAIATSAERGLRPGARVSTPPKLPPGAGHLLARVKKGLLVHSRPGGPPIARLRRTTPFGEPRTLAIHETREKGTWLAVHSPVLGNRRTGWIEHDPAKLRLSRTRLSLEVDLGRRVVEVRRGRRIARRVPIAIGSVGTSTPTGRFQVTDKLPASRFPAAGRAYGCCILALSARQPNLPPDWPGGDRIAIHGTPREQTIGTASSNGCLRATDAELRYLMKRVPVGAPVHIRS